MAQKKQVTVEVDEKTLKALKKGKKALSECAGAFINASDQGAQK